jgi:uncharacterized protein YjbI with pentapeptide repeats
MAGSDAALGVSLAALRAVEDKVHGLPFRRNLDLRNRTIGPPAAATRAGEPAAIGQLDLARRDLRYANLSGATVADTRLDLANLRGAAMIGTRFERVSLRGAQLQGASFERAWLRDVVLDAAIAPDSDWSFATLRDVSARGISLRGARLDWVALELVDFGATTDMSSTFFPKADLTGVTLRASRAYGVSFAHARLELARLALPFTAFDLQSAASYGGAAVNFEGARLDHAVLSAAGLSGLNLPETAQPGAAVAIRDDMAPDATVRKALSAYLLDPPRRDDLRTWYLAAPHKTGGNETAPTDPLRETVQKLFDRRFESRRDWIDSITPKKPIEELGGWSPACIRQQRQPLEPLTCRIPGPEPTMRELVARLASLVPCRPAALPRGAEEFSASGMHFVDNTSWRLWLVLAERLGEGVWRELAPGPDELDPVLRPGAWQTPPVLTRAQREEAAGDVREALAGCLAPDLAARFGEALFLKDPR